MSDNIAESLCDFRCKKSLDIKKVRVQPYQRRLHGSAIGLWSVEVDVHEEELGPREAGDDCDSVVNEIRRRKIAILPKQSRNDKITQSRTDRHEQQNGWDERAKLKINLWVHIFCIRRQTTTTTKRHYHWLAAVDPSKASTFPRQSSFFEPAKKTAIR